ncbi:MAG: glycosyltransferase family 2 protein [Actinobacteria bacterium]|nr:glycosyltransferase family 2 protein [Actinomycetota bacterium]
MNTLPTQTMWPAVTVLLATRDRIELLARAIDAVLDQDYPGDIDVIAVFDQAEPEPSLQSETRRVVANRTVKRNVTVAANVNTPGLPGARNSGIDLVSTELVAFCDDDDVWHSDKLRRQIAVMNDDHTVGMVATGIRVIFDGEVTDRIDTAGEISLDGLLESRLFAAHPSTIVARTSIVRDDIGPVDEAIPGGYAEDYEWMLRACRVTKIAVVRAPLVDVLWHQASFFSERWRMREDALTYLLDRYPEFDKSPRGKARILGQIAFARAAAGDRVGALKGIGETARTSWREPRTVLALGVALGLVSADRVVAELQHRGRGI